MVKAVGDGLVDYDIWLEPYRDALKQRYSFFKESLHNIKASVGSLENMSRGYEYLGFNTGKLEGNSGIWYREWAPEALSLALVGDFNGWNRMSHQMKKDEFGIWSIFLPNKPGVNALSHGSRVKVFTVTKKTSMDRIPAYIKRVEPDEKYNFCGVYWNPKAAYKWIHKQPKKPKGLRVYEAHVGMAQEEPKIGSFDEFRKKILPRIKKSGYNAIQLMALAHHPYYASFGYQVSSFYAVSSFFGTPEELKQLVDAAHGKGLVVLMDLVHSHSVKNVVDGINEFDGSDYQYFHRGARGEHGAWDTKLFDYGKFEVQRFLLSNVNFWQKEFRFDGFRFDGVTSMIYKNHGLGKVFDHYDRYFDNNVDHDAIAFLQLANQLVHSNNQEAITIAEEVSGMPGLALPVNKGGLGFDYRLAMGIPDYWIKVLKEQSDENWNLNEMYKILADRRYKEKHIGYAESHDQGLVGDKTIAFRLMDSEMYDHMLVNKQNLIIDRGVALHKMIRLVTFGAAGEGYLNFMGNEFGHPEWIDFPRPGNNNSFHYARRQWSLADDKKLVYQYLLNFDVSMQKLDEDFGVLSSEDQELVYIHEKDKVLVFRRGNLLFVFNFHPVESYADFQLGVPNAKEYSVVLSSDSNKHGGQDRVRVDSKYPVIESPHGVHSQTISLYIPSRTAQVLVAV